MDNIYNIFDYFSNNVLKNNKKISANEIVQIFIELVLNHKDIKIQKKNKLVLSSGIIVDVNKDNYDTFVELILKYNFKEKDITEIADRLIEDTERRRKGEFYTPTIWVNEAHKMISEQFGDEWKKEYIVWDCAWGTGNLTRDYKFKELYCSTLNEGDLEIGKKYNVPKTIWNEDGAKFQYDFLNDDVEFFEVLKKVKEDRGYLEETDFIGSKLYSVAPSLIRNLLEGKKLMFLINPPYAFPKSGGAKKGNSKKFVHLNTMHKISKKLGCESRQIFLQFLQRCTFIHNLLSDYTTIGVFHPSALYTCSEYKKPMDFIMKYFNYTYAYLINASCFGDVANNWGICFSILNSNLDVFLNDFNIDVITVELKAIKDSIVVNCGYKELYRLSRENKCNAWCKDGLDNRTNKSDVYLKTPLNSGDTKWENPKCENGFLGGLWSNSNIVEKNNQFVSIWSDMVGYNACVNITDTTLLKMLSYFTARKLITGQYATWINGKDEYMIPNVEHKLYKQWESDCIVYSLFNTSSNQSSLRQIDYKDKKWDIKNEFFFMSTEDMKVLANEYFNKEVYQDIKNYGDERYVYKLLKEVKLSEDAQKVLDKAIELTKESFKYRERFNEEHPEYQINTWDAGWYQIKGMLKEYMLDELKEFNEMYKSLGDRMRPLVYELGFLKK